MARGLFLSAAIITALLPGQLVAQSPISQFSFDGDLENSSSFLDRNSLEAPDGTFREGLLSGVSVIGTASFTTGVDGAPGGALVLDGVDDWVNLSVDGHPGDTVPVNGLGGPGLVSGTVMVWVKMDNYAAASPRWLMGSSNIGDSQSWRWGWNNSRLAAQARAAESPANRFVISDSTDNATWADGLWHHVAVAWDGFPAVDEAKIFIDGMPVGTPASGSTLAPDDLQSPWGVSHGYRCAQQRRAFGRFLGWGDRRPSHFRRGRVGYFHPRRVPIGRHRRGS